MLIQSLSHMKNDAGQLPHLDAALACLSLHVHAPAPARFDFCGGYLMLQEGDTKDVREGDFEAHVKYLDVQVLLEGEETIVWNDLSDLICSAPYDEERDKAMYSGDGCVMTIRPGTCYICWPEDGHKACRHIHQQTRFRKAMIKLLLG